MPNPVLSVENLDFRYRGNPNPVLKNLNFRVNKGEIVGLVGLTGAGKSTFYMCLNGLIPHLLGGVMTGQVTVNGLNTAEHEVSELSQHIGMVLQDPEMQLFSTTVRDELAFGPENLTLPREEILRRIEYSCSVVSIHDLLDREPERLSGGQKQRVAIGAILSMLPDILVMDEPTSNLDPQGSQEVYSLIRRLNQEFNKTILFADHKIDDVAELAHRVVVLHNGGFLAQGTPHEVFNNLDVLHEAGLMGPAVTELCHKLLPKGQPLPVTVDEAAFAFGNILPAARNAAGAKLVAGPVLAGEPLRASSSSQPLIEARGLFKTYEGGFQALRGIDLSIAQGEFVAIIGANGSGKTTLVKHFNGLLKPTAGSVRVCGLDTKKTPIMTLARRVGFVFQNPDNQLFRFTVRDEVGFGLKNMGFSKQEIAERTRKALEEVNLLEFSERHPHALSRGQRQRVAIAIVLSVSPDIIVLDEPTTGQDLKSRVQIMDFIRGLNQAGHTIVVVTHDLSLVAQFARRVVVMNEGKIVMDGGPKEVFSNADVLRECRLLPPRITRLASRLVDYGVPGDLVTESQLSEALSGLMVPMVQGGRDNA